MPLGNVENLDLPEQGVCEECGQEIGKRYPHWVESGGVRFVCKMYKIKL